ncbi:MAG: TonB-dependent receptor [bacterium]|nr:TonB-dependent receptor [bacterium]
MKYSLSKISAAIVMTVAVLFSSVQAATTPADSSLVEIDNLVVSGEASAPPVPGKTKIDAETVTLTDPGSLADLGGLLPSVRVATNSRGDSHLMIRGAPERHSQAFLDGIPLNLPWDERVDLETIPITGIGRLEGRRGMPSLLDGPGVLAGSVRILPPQLNGLDRRTQVSYAAGQAGLQRVGLTHQQETGAWNLLGAGGWNKRDSWPLPQGGDQRTNSDLEQFSVLMRGSRAIKNTGRLNLLATGWTGEKGVPAEMHLGDDARFWRYPVRKRALFGAAMAIPRGDWDFTSLVAADFFAQEIDPRGPNNWDAPLNEGDDYEKDFDRTGHFQLGSTRWIGSSSRLSMQANVRYTQHREILTVGGSTESFAQWMTGLVVEGEHRWAEVWNLRAGTGWDHSATPESGDKVKADSFNAPAVNLRLGREISSQGEVYFSASERSRFPSLRELYSGALGRFVANPDLKPERQDMLECGVTAQGKGWNLTGAAFLQYLTNGIEKEKLPGPDRQFMRVNRTSIRVPGLELAGTWRIHSDVEISGQHTIMSARVKENESYDLPAENRPDYLSHWSVNWSGLQGPAAIIEAAISGPSWSADATDDVDGLAHLPAGVRWNFRLSWRWEMGGQDAMMAKEIEAHLRVNNLFDQWTDFQLGLPEPGRVISGGVSIKM